MSKLKKRKDGRYQLNVYIGRSDDGKERYRSVYGKTQKEVRDKADAIKLQLGKGLDLINAEITFSELKRLWSISKEPLLRPSQLKDYLTSLKPFAPLEEKKINRLISVPYMFPVLGCKALWRYKFPLSFPVDALTDSERELP